MKTLLITLALLVALPIHAATQLAVICAEGVTDGTPRKVNGADSCKKIIYDAPIASSMVRCMASDKWCAFGGLQPADNIETVGNDIPAGSVSDGNGGPATSWPILPVSQVPTKTPPVIVTGKNTLDVEWKAPERNCDGSIPPDIVGYRILWGTVNNLSNSVDVGKVLKYTLTGLPAGSVSLTVTTMGSQGLGCGSAGPISALTKAPPFVDAPPVALKVSNDQTVYDLVKLNDGGTLTPIGTVAAMVACKSSAIAPAGFGVVPRAAVALKPTIKVRPMVIFARCQ